MSTTLQPESILILYTTTYREGGQQFQQAAETMKAEKQLEYANHQIICEVVNSKADFIQYLQSTPQVHELHFIGHSGLYGIMFGSREWPEQLSPFEWKSLKIDFTKNARAFFHACRTGRWFADFFSRTFNVKAYGYFWYTTVSNNKHRFQWRYNKSADSATYIISVPGKKSHGYWGSFKKYALRPASDQMLEFIPQLETIDTTYDQVAELYDETFEDISVRKDELEWLKAHLTNPDIHLLDIGCGTGSFLRGILSQINKGTGADLSQGMINEAERRADQNEESKTKLHFKKINGPLLPFSDNQFDVITSVLSFRYLDWDPIIHEMLRVLKPGGRILIMDMVAAPLKWNEIPQFLVDKLKHKLTEIKNPRYRAALHKMVNTSSWKKMLKYNPMRSEHEMKWYLESRFPDSKISVINYAYQSRILAFDSGPVHFKKIQKMSFP